MRRNNSILTVVIVVLVAWLALKFVGGVLGPVLGWLFAFLFPFILIAFGIYGIKRGNRMFGGILLLIGAVMILTKIVGLLFPILVVMVIVAAIYMLITRNNNRRPY